MRCFFTHLNKSSTYYLLSPNGRKKYANLSQKKISSVAKVAPKTAPAFKTAPALKPASKPVSETKPRAASKVTTGSFPDAIPATKFATSAAVEPPPFYVEQKTREDEHAEAIEQLEAKVVALKVKAAEIHQAMDQKLKLYVKLQFGAMSLLGMFNIFG